VLEASDGSQCQDSVVSVSGTIITAGQIRLCSPRANAQQTCKKSGLEVETGIQAPTEGKVLAAKGVQLGLRRALGSCVLHLAHMPPLSVRTLGCSALPARWAGARATAADRDCRRCAQARASSYHPLRTCRRAPHLGAKFLTTSRGRSNAPLSNTSRPRFTALARVASLQPGLPTRGGTAAPPYCLPVAPPLPWTQLRRATTAFRRGAKAREITVAGVVYYSKKGRPYKFGACGKYKFTAKLSS
jgi:hypothetical protein